MPSTAARRTTGTPPEVVPEAGPPGPGRPAAAFVASRGAGAPEAAERWTTGVWPTVVAEAFGRCGDVRGAGSEVLRETPEFGTGDGAADACGPGADRCTTGAPSPSRCGVAEVGRGAGDRCADTEAPGVEACGCRTVDRAPNGWAGAACCACVPERPPEVAVPLPEIAEPSPDAGKSLCGCARRWTAGGLGAARPGEGALGRWAAEEASVRLPTGCPVETVLEPGAGVPLWSGGPGTPAEAEGAAGERVASRCAEGGSAAGELALGGAERVPEVPRPPPADGPGTPMLLVAARRTTGTAVPGTPPGTAARCTVTPPPPGATDPAAEERCTPGAVPGTEVPGPGAVLEALPVGAGDAARRSGTAAGAVRRCTVPRPGAGRAEVSARAGVSARTEGRGLGVSVLADRPAGRRSVTARCTVATPGTAG